MRVDCAQPVPGAAGAQHPFALCAHCSRALDAQAPFPPLRTCEALQSSQGVNLMPHTHLPLPLVAPLPPLDRPSIPFERLPCLLKHPPPAFWRAFHTLCSATLSAAPLALQQASNLGRQGAAVTPTGRGFRLQ